MPLGSMIEATTWLQQNDAAGFDLHLSTHKGQILVPAPMAIGNHRMSSPMQKKLPHSIALQLKAHNFKCIVSDKQMNQRLVMNHQGRTKRLRDKTITQNRSNEG